MKFLNKASKKNKDNRKVTQEPVLPNGFQRHEQLGLSNDEFPINSTEFPLHGVEFPIYNEELPINSVEFPIHSKELPINSAEFPIHSEELPINGAEFPIHNEELPIGSAELPIQDIAPPLPEIDFPQYDFESPLTEFESPLSEFESPLPEIESPQAELKDPLKDPMQDIAPPQQNIAPSMPEIDDPLQDVAPPQQPGPLKPPKPQQKKKKKEKHVYPDATLSDKQLEALQKVLGPDVDIKTGERTEDQKGGKGSKGSRKRKSMHDPLVIEDRSTYSVVRTVFVVVFIVLFLAAACFSGWYYWWTTHATFEFELQPVVVLNGQSFDPNDFLYPGEAERGLSASLQSSELEPILGLQYVPLTIKLGLRSMESAEAMYVLAPVEYYQHEFKDTGTTLRPVEFLINADSARGASFDIRFAEPPLPLDSYEVGEYPLKLALNDTPFEVMLRIVDTTAPTATGVSQEIRVGDDVAPEFFVTDIFDHSPIRSISFAEEPNVYAREPQTVRIAIEDIFDNVGIISAELTTIFNQMPPEITVPTDMIESEVGTPVDYLLENATALDDFGRPVEVHVDDGAVNADEEGVYIAVFWAEDLSGNRTEVDVTVYVIGVAPEQIYQQIDEVLGRIINDSMTQVQKVRHINDWIRWSIRGTTTESEMTSLLGGAHIALRDRQGDYNVISALSSVMLTRAGVENMFIERHSDAEGRHRWNLINPDGRGWHHFDAYPTGLGLGNGQMSMFTDRQAQDFANRIRNEDYYKYDSALYPEVVSG